MGDRFFHPDGKKAQDIELRGKKLIRKTGESPSGDQSASENVRRRKQLLEESYGASGGRAGTRGQRKSGVSGYKTPKGQVKEGLDRADKTEDEEVKVPQVVPMKRG